MGFIKARSITTPSHRGFKHLLGWSGPRTSGTSLFSIGTPSLGERVILICIHIDIIIIHPIEGVRASSFGEVRELEERLAKVVDKDAFALRLEHLPC